MNSKSRKPYLKLALKDNLLVSIADVENGKGCNCICPECKSPLVARNNGKIKVHHFAHVAEYNCRGGVETALHLLSKEILKDTKRVYIPNYSFYYPDLKFKRILLQYDKLLKFDSVKVEEKIQIGADFVIVDALCEINGKKLIIEFAKSHYIDDRKREKLLALGIACLEISVSSGEQSKKLLTRQLHSNAFKAEWIVNRRGEGEIEPNRAKIIQEHEAAKKSANLERDRREKIQEVRKLKRITAEQERMRSEAVVKKIKLDEAAKKGNLVFSCPVRKELTFEFGQKLRSSRPIITRLSTAKEISPIYESQPGFIDIFIDTKQEILIPKDYDQLSEIDKKASDSLYRSVLAFLDYRDMSNFDPCRYCRCFNGKVFEYIICTYNASSPLKTCFEDFE